MHDCGQNVRWDIWCVSGLTLLFLESDCSPGSEMQYVLSYVEEVRRHGSIKWTMRQIGVYHRYSSVEDKSLWILLYNRPNSLAQKRLETMIKNRSDFRHI